VNAAAQRNAARANANANYNGVNRTPFFNDPGARRQLNLNNSQYNNLNQAYQNAYQRYNQSVNQLDPNMTEQQRELQLQQFQSQFNQDLSGTVNSTLTDPQARSRYSQLNNQFNGFNAFNDPTVRRQLNLTPDQIRQLRTLSGNWRQQLQQFRAGNNGQGTVDPTEWAQMQQQFATQLNGVLTPQQQQMWAQQTGQQYNFAPSTFFDQQDGNVQQVPVAQPTGTPPVAKVPVNGQVPVTSPGSAPVPKSPTTGANGTGTQSGTAQAPQGGTTR